MNQFPRYIGKQHEEWGGRDQTSATMNAAVSTIYRALLTKYQKDYCLDNNKFNSSVGFTQHVLKYLIKWSKERRELHNE